MVVVGVVVRFRPALHFRVVAAPRAPSRPAVAPATALSNVATANR